MKYGAGSAASSHGWGIWALKMLMMVTGSLRQWCEKVPDSRLLSLPIPLILIQRLQELPAERVCECACHEILISAGI